MHKKFLNIFTFISKFKKEEILNLDKNIGIIFRKNENDTEKEEIISLKNFCKQNNRKLYLANDIKLAINLKLDGVYLSAFNKSFDVLKYNIKKNFLILGSAHNIFEIKMKEKQGVEIIFLSPLFKTKNYKSGLGIIRFNLLSALSKKKVIALGGITKKNINYLKTTNVYGFSGISYFFKNL